MTSAPPPFTSLNHSRHFARTHNDEDRVAYDITEGVTSPDMPSPFMDQLRQRDQPLRLQAGNALKVATDPILSAFCKYSCFLTKLFSSLTTSVPLDLSWDGGSAMRARGRG